MARAISELCQAPYSIEVILLLRDRQSPLTTSSVMEGVRVKNWSTIAKTLRVLKDANIVMMEERSVGRHKSRAKFWTLEPGLGEKVASMLHDVDQLMMEANGVGATSLRPPGRPGIVDVEFAGEKLVAVIQNAVNAARG